MIKAHGGKLIDNVLSIEDKKAFEEKKGKLKNIKLNSRQISDVEMIAIGAYSPLEGFMGKADYESVVNTMRLSCGQVWSIPVTLAVSDKEAALLKEGDEVTLSDESGTVIAVMNITEKYLYDKEVEAEKVYKTKDANHPGVAAVYEQEAVLLAGTVKAIDNPKHSSFTKYYLTPKESRQLFIEKGWNTVVGFQTRNPIHRAHEYLQKCAMEMYDGLFLHPLVGQTKAGDISAEVRMLCYEELIDKYYPKDRVVLGINPASMRYAGPREAIFHALIRKNYGCTHFIVGRDHAGVGNYYGTYDAQKIFLEFSPEELGIVPLFFEHSFYCRKCGSMASVKTCPHSKEDRVALSGTKVREMLQNEEIPPVEFTRPEIAKILIEGMKKTN